MRQTLQSLDSNKDGIISPKVIIVFGVFYTYLGAVVRNNEENSHRKEILYIELN